MSGQASLANELVLAEDRDNSFLALLGYDSDLDPALFDVENGICIIALGKNDFLSLDNWK